MDDLQFWEILLTVFFLLQVKHFAADFVLQKPRHFLNKGTYGHWGGIEHALMHGVLTWAALFYFTNPAFSLAMGALDSVIHYHVDWAKVRVNNHFNLTADRDQYWWLFGADQLAHQLTYLLIIYIVLWLSL